MSNTSEDKDWASKYLLGPLTSPEPSQLMGPGTHFGSVMDRKSTPPPAYPTPPTSANPSPSTFSSRNPFRRAQPNQAFPDLAQGEPAARSNDKTLPTGDLRSRTGSLSQRYPGDDSHRPLDMIRKHTKAADRAPHLKKKHLPRADMIDSLDASMDRLYHHEGPYDATLLSRNMEKKFSPVEALRGSNEEALKATPRENIRDALDKHVPLQGTAIVPPGSRNAFGEVFDYTEGADLMREPDAPGGAYKRWDGVKYLPEDYKGKGEPSFSYERAINKNPQHRRIVSEDSSAYEMQPPRSRPSHQRSTSGAAPELRRSPVNNSMGYSEFERDMRRSNSVGRKFGDGLKRRLGSLRRNKKSSEE